MSKAAARMGAGRKCMKILFFEVWPRDKRILVDVLCHNSAAIAFWRSVGFTDYSLSLEIYPEWAMPSDSARTCRTRSAEAR
jgi:ribosomal protein S18 acetylase RimI-like enzyme